MSQINPKECVHKTAYSVQLPYIAGIKCYLFASEQIRNFLYPRDPDIASKNAGILSKLN